MMVNPYNVSKYNRHNEASGFQNDPGQAGTVAAAAVQQQDNNQHDNNRRGQFFSASMGTQSQTRKKTTQKVRNRPKHQLKAHQRRSTVQLAVFSSKRAFDPTKDCTVCAARHLNQQGRSVSVPHRPHHRICPKNVKTKGRSERFVEEENLAKEIMEQNQPKFTSGELHRQGTTSKAKEQFLNIRQTTGNKNTIPASDDDIKNEVLPDAACLRKVLDKLMAEDPNPKGNAPVPILHMVQYFLDQFNVRRSTGSTQNDLPQTACFMRAMEFYRRHLPSGTFKFPEEDRVSEDPPSPHYHSIEGQTIFFVAWELTFPGIKLKCTKPCCNGELGHDRFDFTKNRSLFPIIDQSGNVSWACVMQYKCTVCEARVSGNDGTLLSSLPAPIRDAYPVHPKYATTKFGKYHLSMEMSDDLEDCMLTYSNAEYVSKKMYKRQNKEYLKRIQSYMDWCYCRHWDYTQHRSYPKVEDWSTQYPPTGDSLRKLYNEAKRSSLTETELSDHMRHTQEIQSVGCRLSSASDHTVDVTRNYNLPGAKDCFDVSVETGEIATVVLVESTKIQQAAHAIEVLSRRKNFTPKLHYTDICPHNDDFFHQIFGAAVILRLGLFHFVQRFIKTLRDSHIDYWAAIVKLKKCIYEYDKTDEANLLLTLETGTMAKDGHRYSPEEIHKLKHSPKWKRRYSKWMKKRIHPTSVIRQNLSEWWMEFKTHASEGQLEGRGRLDPTTGKKLFTPETKIAFDEQVIKCQFIGDVLPTSDLYTAIPPGPRSTHGLYEYISHRGESNLESFHLFLANFGNTNTNPALADVLHLEGTATHNVKRRYKLFLRSLSRQALKDRRVPSHLHQCPRFFDHSLLQHINNKAELLGIPEPFDDVTPLQEDNGERFLSEYYEEQKLRNRNIPRHPTNKRCQCEKCAMNPIPLPHELEEILADDSAVALFNEDEGMDETNDHTSSPTPLVTVTGKTVTITVTKATIHVPQDGAPSLVARQPLPPPPPQQPMGFAPLVYSGLSSGQPLAITPAWQFPTAPAWQYSSSVRHCCPRYAVWAHKPRRNGRPPHDTWCRNRTGLTKAKAKAT
jgi:hypothetical protein